MFMLYVILGFLGYGFMNCHLQENTKLDPAECRSVAIGIGFTGFVGFIVIMVAGWYKSGWKIK